jgi:hypothetical protein
LRRKIGESGEDTGKFVGERGKSKRDIGTFWMRNLEKILTDQ